jgi:hypothetical protein
MQYVVRAIDPHEIYWFVLGHGTLEQRPIVTLADGAFPSDSVALV